MQNQKEHEKKRKSSLHISNKKIKVLKERIKVIGEAKYVKITLKKSFWFLRNLPTKVYFLILSTNFLVGLLILYYTSTIKHFFPHLVCLTINISITLRIGRDYIDTLRFLYKEICTKHTNENTELRTTFIKFYTKAMHNANLLMCIIIAIIFIWGIFSQHYITTDLVGFYAVFMVCISVSFSVIGYMQYIWILWFLFRISKCSSMHFNRFAPANTPFLVKIAALLQQAKWCFLIEGFCYTFEYFILIPKENITSTEINMPDNFSFLITWIIIFLVIVLAFPLIVFWQEHLLTQIVSNLKNQRIEYLSMQYEQLEQYDTQKNNIFNTYLYYEMLNKLSESADYPLKIQRLGPTIVSIATVCLHIITLLTQLPGLQYLLNL